ncbi:MAG: hypothetical protein SCM11_00655 [Bacillota bacterium]|nr:hypothetical protein [Bacillota bacterium]
MKRLLFILCLIALLSMTTSCFMPINTNSGATVNNDKSSGVTTKTESNSNQTTSTNKVTTTNTTSKQESEASVEEQILIDQDGIVIKLKSLSSDPFWGPSLKLLIENNRKNSVMIQTRNSTVNGVMMEAMFSCDIAPNKKANEEIVFMSSDLEVANIEVIREIEFYFTVSDASSWEDIFDSDTIYIKTSAFDTHVQTYDDSGFIALDQRDIKLVIKRLDSEDSFWGAEIYVYLENNSKQNITVQIEDCSINGFMIDPMFSCDVLAGKKAFDTITLMESDLEENEIESIDEIELYFNVFNADTWDDIFQSDIVKISFSE